MKKYLNLIWFVVGILAIIVLVVIVFNFVFQKMTTTTPSITTAPSLGAKTDVLLEKFLDKVLNRTLGELIESRVITTPSTITPSSWKEDKDGTTFEFDIPDFKVKYRFIDRRGMLMGYEDRPPEVADFSVTLSRPAHVTVAGGIVDDPTKPPASTEPALAPNSSPAPTPTPEPSPAPDPAPVAPATGVPAESDPGFRTPTLKPAT